MPSQNAVIDYGVAIIAPEHVNAERDRVQTLLRHTGLDLAGDHERPAHISLFQGGVFEGYQEDFINTAADALSGAHKIEVAMSARLRLSPSGNGNIFWDVQTTELYELHHTLDRALRASAG